MRHTDGHVDLVLKIHGIILIALNFSLCVLLIRLHAYCLSLPTHESTSTVHTGRCKVL